MNSKINEENLLYEVTLSLLLMKQRYQNEKSQNVLQQNYLKSFPKLFTNESQQCSLERNQSEKKFVYQFYQIIKNKSRRSSAPYGNKLKNQDQLTNGVNILSNQRYSCKMKEKPTTHINEPKKIKPKTQTKKQSNDHEAKVIHKNRTINRKQMYDQLKVFLNQKPKPSWANRLENFFAYNQSLIVGWKENFTSLPLNSKLKPQKIIVQKKLFKIFGNLTKTSSSQKDFLRIYKSSQRGVEEFFKKYGYRKISNYSRQSILFELK
ncbi:hypothetical protein M0812_11525 [Anaeramoeba flamelloides]|uniref:Uncharacterized protein n=1 Tax=Anaeramoeba flamelloides TaxID=1746091 RepID=A0AAV7ZZ84_9EUKA|nr:hypothetical protein M0812_11525 [Anaeramoeba flamelloides]